MFLMFFSLYFTYAAWYMGLLSMMHAKAVKLVLYDVRILTTNLFSVDFIAAEVTGA